VVLLHLVDYQTAQSNFKKFNLDNIERIGDPYYKFYGMFWLTK